MTFLTASIGCVDQSLKSNLSQRGYEIDESTLSLSEQIATGKVQYVSWKNAKRTLLERNLLIQRSADRVERLEKRKKDQWKTWLPTFNLNVSLDESLSRLGDLSFSDLNASLIAPLRIPNPLTERATAFDHSLSLLQAKANHELVVRRQIISLYRAYLQFMNLELAQQKYERRKQSDDLNGALSSLEEKDSYRQRKQALEATLAQQLNIPGFNKLPKTSTLPKINYEGKISKLKPGKNYGKLATRLSSYEIQGAILREKGIKLTRWPLVSLSTSLPPLYDSRSDDSSLDFGSDRIILFGSLNQNYDFTGNRAESIQTAEDNTQLVKKNILLNIDSDARNWNTLRQKYSRLLLRRKILKERLASLNQKSNKIPVRLRLDAIRSAEANLDSSFLALKELETQIWLWDDDAWK